MLKTALLDDNKHQLNSNLELLQNSGLVDILFYNTSSEEFITNFKTNKPDLIFIDLTLGNDSMKGIEVAYKLKTHVLFVSSDTKEYIKDIEHLKRDFDICVDHITKPFSDIDFIKSTRRFIKEIELFSNQNYVFLDFSDKKRNRILLDSIVYLNTDKNNGSTSGNKQIFFNDREFKTLIDFSFKNSMEEKGLSKEQFIEISKSCRVNKNHIKNFDKKNYTIEVDIHDKKTFTKSVTLDISENYFADIKKLLK